MIRAAVMALALAAPAEAETLRPFDMEDVPYGLFALQGGTFHGQLSNNSEPFRSSILFLCIDCDARSDAFVGLFLDARDDGSAIRADPDAFADLQQRICDSSDRTECMARAVTHAGLPGFSIESRLGDRWLVREVFFASGLTLLIESSDLDKATARANTTHLRDTVAPFVTGTTP